MKIDKAIKQLQFNLDSVGNIVSPITRESLQLGIEALKRIQDIRIPPFNSVNDLLPGETQE